MTERAGQDPLPDGTADVWWARSKDASDRLAFLLDETERRRWAAYRRVEDRERFLVGCALAKAALARYTGRRPADVRLDRTCPRCGESHGKPVIAGGGPGHSVAHSGDLIAVAADAGPPRVTAWPYPRSSREVSLLDLDAAAGLSLIHI